MRTYRALVIALLAASLAAVLLLGSGRTPQPVHAGGGACPASFFLGFYGFRGDGLSSGLRGSQPIATEGEMTVSPDPFPAQWTGTILDRATINDGRTVTRLTLTGTYRMSGTDCTGSAVVSASNGTTFHYDLVLTQWVNGPAGEVFFIQTDPRSVETLTLVSM